MKWDLATIARATGGTAHGNAEIERVVTDSRDAAPRALFVAVRGERHDGHDFAAQAADAGSAVLVERGRRPEAASGVEVDETLTALARLAVLRRSEIDTAVVAITGSSGKTTTKDMTAAALGPGTHAAPRSYNNEVGVPLTVLGTPDDATSLVVEVGSRGAGHIAALAGAIAPDVAVITNIGPAHLEMFGDVEAVLEAKWELVEALSPTGVAVLPAGDARLAGRRDGAMMTFGDESTGADVAVSEVAVDRLGRASFLLGYQGSTRAIALAQAGLHQPMNAAAAVAAALALGRDFDEVVDRVAAAEVSPWRMEVVEVPVAGGSAVIVNDAYNANPDSMSAAFATVGAMPGRRIAVLGKMYELGPHSADLHRDVGKQAVSSGFDIVLVVGDDPGLATGAGAAAEAIGDVDGAVERLTALLEPGDVVLVKASRAAGLERVAQAIGGGA